MMKKRYLFASLRYHTPLLYFSCLSGWRADTYYAPIQLLRPFFITPLRRH
jgi:hypothetical protein